MDLLEVLNFQSILVAALAVTAAGVVGFWVKDFPLEIWKFLKRQFTTRLSVTTMNPAFYVILDWLANTYPNKNFRNLKITNGRYGYNEDAIMSVGYGGHFIRYGRHILHLRLSEKDSSATEYDKELIEITKLGRSRKLFDRFFQDTNCRESDSKIKLFQMNSDYWHHMGEIANRPMDSVFIKSKDRRALLEKIDKFIASENWYTEHGVPYQLGILLYGHPGTGKTSLIKAIAAYLKYDISYLPTSRLYKLEAGLEKLPNRSILVIEDVDCDPAAHERSKPAEKNLRPGVNKTIENPTMVQSLDPIIAITSMSDILNAIDGLWTTHGRILIMTTNHIDKLDAALLRPGRVDLMLEIGYADCDILNQFSLKFYGKPIPDYIFEAEKYGAGSTKIRKNLTGAVLQEMVLRGLDYDEFVQAIKY